MALARQFTSDFPPSSGLIHSGPFKLVRIQSRKCARVRHIHLTFQCVNRLFGALLQPLVTMGIRNVSRTAVSCLFGAAVDHSDDRRAPAFSAA
jgi:hypothetical protein